MKSIYINQFYVEKPKNRVIQDDLLNWIIKSHQLAESKNTDLNNKTENVGTELIEKLFQRYAVKSAQISQRYLECDDMLSSDFENNKIYKINESQASGVSINERAHFFSERAFEIFKKFYDLSKKNNKPNHLIHVTCTGYISPSAAQKIVTDPFIASKTSYKTKALTSAAGLFK